MVDVVLGSLMRSAGARSAARVGARSRTRVLDRRRTRRSSTPASDDQRALPASVSISMHVGTGPIWRPALTTSVEPMRSIQPPSAANGDWCTCPHRTMAGWCCSIHADEIRRRRSAACRSSSWVTRRAARGTPRSTADRRRAPASCGELAVDDLAGARSVPPRAHRDQHVLGLEVRRRRRRRPTRRAASSHCAATLVVLVAGVEIVVPRARDDGGLGRDARRGTRARPRSARRARRSRRCRGGRRPPRRGRSRPRRTTTQSSCFSV